MLRLTVPEYRPIVAGKREVAESVTSQGVGRRRRRKRRRGRSRGRRRKRNVGTH